MAIGDVGVPAGCVLTISGPHRKAAPDDRWQAWVTAIESGEGRVVAFAGGGTADQAAGDAITRARAGWSMPARPAMSAAPVAAALPGVLALIQEATDEATALRVADAFGGTVVWVSEREGSDTQMSRLVGADAAARIATAVGVGAVRVPSAAAVRAAARRERVLQMRRDGMSLRRIARETGLSTERVRQILRSGILRSGS